MTAIVSERERSSQRSSAEETLWLLIRAEGLPQPQRQYPFIPGRRYRADFAFPAYRLLAEVEGGAWVQGRHTRPRGFEADCMRQNEAVVRGWRLVRFTPAMVEDGRAIATLRALLGSSTEPAPGTAVWWHNRMVSKEQADGGSEPAERG